MPAGANMLDAHARQPEDDLGFGRAAQQPVGPRIARRRVAGHRKAERRGGERLGLLLDRPARAPPPGTMDEGPVRRVHQPDHGMVDRRGEADALDEIGRASVEPVEQRDVRGRGRVLAEKHPDVALHLARRIAAGMDAAGRKALARHQRGDQRCSARSCRTASRDSSIRSRRPSKRPALSGMPRCGQRSRSAKALAGRVAADQDRLAEHHFRHASPGAAAAGSAARNTRPRATARRRVARLRGLIRRVSRLRSASSGQRMRPSMIPPLVESPCADAAMRSRYPPDAGRAIFAAIG